VDPALRQALRLQLLSTREVVIIIIKVPYQAIASTPSTSRPSGRQKEGAPLHYVCNYYAHSELAQNTQKCSQTREVLKVWLSSVVYPSPPSPPHTPGTHSSRQCHRTAARTATRPSHTRQTQRQQQQAMRPLFHRATQACAPAGRAGLAVFKLEWVQHTMLSCTKR
jgi:hypothetical protein